MDAMVDDHGKLVDKLESRVDKDTVEKWKGQVARDARRARRPRST